MKIKCITCGKFLSNKEMQDGGGASWVYVPDTDLSYEENYWKCKRCTTRTGRLLPKQCVSLEFCSGMA